MDIFNDFDLCQEALKKVNLNEAAMPVVRGVIVEDIDTYNKIQMLLNIQAFEPCHRFLYNLDVEQLSEGEASKVNNLYKLAEERGFIEKEEPEDGEGENAPTKECDAIPATPTPAPVAPAQPPASTSDSAFTVAYSAVKDGQLKTGEAYSNAISTRAAKADVISKLERAGYSSISILCIEVGDPDVRGCDNTFIKQPEVAPTPALDTKPAISSIDNPISTFEADDEKDDSGDDNSGDDSDDSDDKDNSDNDDSDNSDDSDDSDDDKDDKDDKEKDDDKKEEDAEEPDEKLDDKSDDKAEAATDDKDASELTPEEKTALKDSYKKAFKAALQKCKFYTSFSELSLEQKVKFFTELSKAWGDKADPSKFLTDKELEQLEKIVVKKPADDKDK